MEIRILKDLDFIKKKGVIKKMPKEVISSYFFNFNVNL